MGRVTEELRLECDGSANFCVRPIAFCFGVSDDKIRAGESTEFRRKKTVNKVPELAGRASEDG